MSQNEQEILKLKLFKGLSCLLVVVVSDPNILITDYPSILIASIQQNRRTNVPSKISDYNNSSVD